MCVLLNGTDSVTLYTDYSIHRTTTLWYYYTPEDGGGENFAENVNSRSFNLHRDYSKSLTFSNVGELSWS